MTRWAVAMGVLAALAAGPVAAQATPSVLVIGPASNPIRDGIATFTIAASGFAPADLPLRLQLQISTSSSFDGPLVADTTLNGPTAIVTIPRLLPGSGQLFWRAFALTARAGSVPSVVTGPISAPTHLRLVTPNNAAGQSLGTRRPTFTWTTSHIPPAIGAWDFEFHIDETATGKPRLIVNTSDTTLTIGEDLEANTSYRWSVKARLRVTGDSLTVQSTGTFVILSDESPFATLLHHPFPSPFRRGGSTCVWFDLNTPGTVTLDVLDIRGLPVTHLVPSSSIPSTAFQEGRYGRPSPGATSGCDDRFSWDGTDARGRAVPPGVYVIWLRAAGRSFKERVVLQ